MRIGLFCLAALVCCVGALQAQPRVDQIQNNYSYPLPGDPNYGIAQGSIFIIKGANLSTTTTELQNAPLRTNLNGVTARVTVGGTTTDVIWYYLTPNQLGGILPSRTPAGEGTLTVTNSAGTSAPVPIKVVPSAFGTLTLNGSGTGAAAVYDLEYRFLSSTNSAKPGDTILLYGTGIGPSAGDETVQQTPANLDAVPITVEIGGVPATVSYRGRTIYPGLDQINVVVPSGVTFGCNVPLVIRTGAYSSNSTTIPVAATNGACPAPNPGGNGGGSSEDITISQAEIDSWIAAGAFRSGSIGLTRQSSYSISDAPTGGTITTVDRRDSITAGFNRVGGADLRRLLTAGVGGMTAGNCIVYRDTIVNPYPNLTYTPLDAGSPLTVRGPAGARTVPGQREAGFLIYALDIPTADFVNPGTFTISGPGGPDIGAFSGTLQVAPDLQWTNRPNLAVVDRSQPLTVTWSGGEPTTLVTIQGTSTTIQGSTASSVSFQCFARNTDGQFTVPTSILTQLPASTRIAAGPISILQRGTLAVASVGKGARVRASGIDYLTLGNQWGISQSAEYK